MAETTYKKQSSWEDRFQMPTSDQMREDLAEKPLALIDTARAHILALADLTEQVTWQGLPWRWTVCYDSPLDDTRALVHLVLNPNAPELAMTFTADMVERLPMKRLKKHVRDGVLLGRQVAGVYWSSWELANKTQLQDLLDLVTRKHKLLIAGSKD